MNPLDKIDPEDRKILKGKDLNYIRGWNKFKRKQGSSQGSPRSAGKNEPRLPKPEPSDD
jgi:hypothetical protein